MGKSKSKNNKTLGILITLAVVIIVLTVAVLAVLYFTNDGIKDKLNVILDKISALAASNEDNDNLSGNDRPNLPSDNDGDNLGGTEKPNTPTDSDGDSTGGNDGPNTPTDTDGDNTGGNEDENNPSDSDFPDVLTDYTVSVHFLELGNKYTGDCTLIKCGDVEVLIDAGSRTSSSKAIKEYVDQYCTDGVLEYVIATHAHQDHIAGFVGSKANPGVFESFVCETIIDFPMTNATSTVYKNYVEKRDAEIANGAKHYTALECYNNKNGAKRTYELGENVSLTILYNYYYEHETDDENDYSVCCLLNNNGVYSLFTGDLEKEGEERLVENNDLPECKLFKGGHHGSYTASTETLLSAIKPEIVCVCCCCGSTEYTDNMDNVFPAQAFIDRVTKYTLDIYVTTLVEDFDEGTVTPLNGNIVVLFNAKGEVAISCSNNNTKFTETEWFNKYRKLNN